MWHQQLLVRIVTSATACKNVNAWSLFDNLIVTCDESEENTLENVVTSPNNGINYWLIAVILLAISSLIVGGHGCYMKRELIILCLLSYWYIDEYCKRNYYFFNDMINIKDLYPNKIKTDKMSHKNILTALDTWHQKV